MIDFDKINDWRYERKFVISEFHRFQLEQLIAFHPAMFSEIYYERTVNNLYFDTIENSSFYDNIVGKDRRLKMRIRWYGDAKGLIKNPMLELKIKNGNLGSKIAHELESIKFDNTLTEEKIVSIIKNSNIPQNIQLFLTDFKFSIINQYKRKYFLSANKKFRLTIDYDIKYTPVYKIFNNFIFNYHDRLNTILELKYLDKSDNFANNISGWFPFRISKNSKYVTGLEILNYY